MFIVRIEGPGEDVEAYYTPDRPIAALLGDQPAIKFVARNGSEPGGVMLVPVARVITVAERHDRDA